MKKKLFLFVFLMTSISQISVSANPDQEDNLKQEVESIINKYYLNMTGEKDYFPNPDHVWWYALNHDENRSEKLQLCVKMENELHKVYQKYRDVRFRTSFLYGYIENTIDKKYSKDQFETQSQYESRVQKELWTHFTEVCTQAYGYMEQNLEVKIIPKYYDAETRRYYLFVKESYYIPKNNMKFWREDSPTCFYTYVVISPDEARFLKTMDLTSMDIFKISWCVEKALTPSIMVSSSYDCYDYGEWRNIAEFSISLPTGTRIKIHTLGTSNPLSVSFSDFHYNVQALKNRKWSYDDVRRTYNQLDAQLQKEVAKYNPQYQSNPFNLKKKPLDIDIHLNNQYRFNLQALRNEYNNKVQILPQLVDNEIDKLKQQLRRQDVNRYIEINEQLDSIRMAVAVAKMKEEYRCYNFTEQELKLSYIDNKQPASQTCKEKYIHLFKSDEDFRESYSSNSFEEDIAQREVIYANYSEKDQDISRCIQQKIKLKFQGSIDYKGDMASPQGHAKLIASYINAKKIDMLNPSYAEGLLKKCFSLDNNMSKEYEKNGSFFSTKRAFFESYTSGSYKTDLKKAKKSRK